MSWMFETDPQFQEELDCVAGSVRDEVTVDIVPVEAAMPQVIRDVAGRATQIHGWLAVCEMPVGESVLESHQMGLVEGATQVHKVQLAQRLRGVGPAPDLFPTGHLPTLRAGACEHFTRLLDTDLDIAA